ncbi:HAMP domain-containing sensor histidine kinase [Streptomyces sp. Rer75]|uniref:sensor histidine kinase n=1 Tax=Streptomyces sp. Rer75 TaxID=2750011 RepID=UPI0015D02971|nr:HAMP domain-containing sensor histidine kinase [Streptomyces sp. Rer75]QLH23146.1 HAMP domain-containing histidine kinase [Streptomyces sp. Rer75]
MRRQLLWLTAATTALVLAALLVPLVLLTRGHAADRATADATQRAQSLAAVVGRSLAHPDPRDGMEQVRTALDGVNGPGLPRSSVILPDGRSLGARAPVTDAVRLARHGRAFLYAPEGGGRVALVPVQGITADPGAGVRSGGTAVVQVAVDQRQLYDGVLASWLAIAGIGAGLILLGLLVADRLGARLVGATRRLASVADRLAAGDLTARAEPEGPPELRLVAAQLNHLASRIDELLAAERENAADLAHRLRTPVAVLRLDAEGLRDSAEAERIAADVAALERSVDEVIQSARHPLGGGTEGAEGGGTAAAEAGRTADLAALARERSAFWLPLAEDQDRTVAVDIPEQPVPVRVGETDLTAVLDVLLGNVFDHTPHGTAFRVAVRPDDGGSGGVLVVEDDGPGFPSGDMTGRGTSGAGSTGLGLDIARRTARESGGEVVVAPAAAPAGNGAAGNGASGARITVRFGAPPAPADGIAARRGGG